MGISQLPLLLLELLLEVPLELPLLELPLLELPLLELPLLEPPLLLEPPSSPPPPPPLLLLLHAMIALAKPTATVPQIKAIVRTFIVVLRLSPKLVGAPAWTRLDPPHVEGASLAVFRV